MSWGTYYKHEGYLSHIGKNEIENKREECQRINDMLAQDSRIYGIHAASDSERR